MLSAINSGIGSGRGTYVIEIKLDFIPNMMGRGRVRNVEDPILAYGDLIGCRCHVGEEAGEEACEQEE